MSKIRSQVVRKLFLRGNTFNIKSVLLLSKTFQVLFSHLTFSIVCLSSDAQVNGLFFSCLNVVMIEAINKSVAI